MPHDDEIHYVPMDRVKRRARRAPNTNFVPFKLDITDPGQWQDREPPPRNWLVQNTVPKGVVTLLYGGGGVGKSILSIMLAVAAALGRDWIGLPVERCKSLYFSAEDGEDELWRRLAKIVPAYDADFADISGEIGLIDRARMSDNALMDYGVSETGYGRGPFEETSTYHSLAEATRDFGAGLVIVDPLYSVFAGNENNRHEANAFISAMSRLAMDMNGGEGGAVLILAHPSKSGREEGEAGVTAWSDSARSRLHLRRPKDEDDAPDRDIRELAVKKLNFAPDGGVIRMRWEDGLFVFDGGQNPSFVGSIDRAAQRRRCEEVFLSLLDCREAENRPVSHKSRSGNYAPKAFSKMPARGGFTRKDFEAAMEALFAEKRITAVQYGNAPSRQFDKIVRAK